MLTKVVRDRIERGPVRIKFELCVSTVCFV